MNIQNPSQEMHTPLPFYIFVFTCWTLVLFVLLVQQVKQEAQQPQEEEEEVICIKEEPEEEQEVTATLLLNCQLEQDHLAESEVR